MEPSSPLETGGQFVQTVTRLRDGHFYLFRARGLSEFTPLTTAEINGRSSRGTGRVPPGMPSSRHDESDSEKLQVTRPPRMRHKLHYVTAMLRHIKMQIWSIRQYIMYKSMDHTKRLLSGTRPTDRILSSGCLRGCNSLSLLCTNVPPAAAAAAGQ